MKRNLNRLMGIMLTLVLMLAMSLTAYADSTIYNPASTYDGFAALASGDDTVSIEGVQYNNTTVDWYVIGYDSTAKTVTLLSKQPFGNSKFNNFKKNGRNYDGSVVKSYVEGLTEAGQPLAGIKDVLAYVDVADPTVTGKVPYLLNISEASNNLTETKRKGVGSGFWWLRSPGGGTYGNLAAFVHGENGIVSEYGGDVVDSEFGVRPALKLNLSSVIFSSKSNTFFVKEPTPTATFTATGADTGTLSGVADGMKYSLGGTTWVDITSSADIDLTGLSAGSIQVVKKGNGTTTVDSDPKTITVTKATAPTTAAAVNCTTADNNDGKLTGVEITMEYKKSDDAAWTPVTGSNITNLTPGTYYVRVKATGTALASANQELTIKSVQTIAAENVYATFGDTDKSVSASVTNPATGVGVITYAVKEGSGNYIGVNANGALTIKAVPPADGKAYVTVTAAGTDTCVETTKDVTVTVGKADPTAPIGLTATYGQTLANVTLPDGWTWADSTQSIGNVVDPAATFKANFAGDDNHNAASNMDVTVTVGKADSAVTKAPEAKTLNYNGSAQELVIAGTATGGSMQYALGTATEATEPYTTSIPTGTEAGTYYVWYIVRGDGNHNDTAAKCIPVTIASKAIFTVTFVPGDGTGSMDPVQVTDGETFIFPASEFTAPSGHVFAHWMINDRHYAIGEQITVNSDLTVASVWAPVNQSNSRFVTKALTSVPASLHHLYHSVSELINALLFRLSDKGNIATLDNTVIYDVILQVLINGEWVEATPEYFPAGTLSVTFPYPSGTGKDTHNFIVCHMFTVKMHGHEPGGMETPDVKKTDEGLQVELDGLSPVAISWNTLDTNKAIESLPQTGDSEHPFVYLTMSLAALAALSLLAKKRR